MITSRHPPYPYPAQMVGLDPSLAVVVYLSPTGDDANDGLSAASPLATFAEARRKFPIDAMGGAGVTLRLAAGAYETPDLYLGGGGIFSSGYEIEGPAMALATLATGPSTAAMDAAPVEAGTATTFSFTVAAPGWTADDMRAKRCHVRVTRAGAHRIYELPIESNTADAFVARVIGIAADILAADTVQIVVPSAARIQGPAGMTPAPVLRIHGSGTIRRVELGDFLAMTDDLLLDRCTKAPGDALQAAVLLSGRAALVNCSFSDVRLTWQCGTKPLVSMRSDPSAPANTASVCGVFHDASIYVGGIIGVPGSPNWVGAGTFSPEGAISVFPPGGGAACVTVNQPAAFFLPQGAAVGSGGHGVGLHATLGGAAYINAHTTLAGTGGDLQVGADPAVTYAAFVGAGSNILETGGTSRIMA